MCIALKYGIWNVSQPAMESVNALVGSGYKPLTSMILASRGISGEKAAREYLSCGLRALGWSLPVGMVLMLGVKLLLANVANGGMEIPWWAVVAATASVFLVVGSSMLYALTRIRKDNPIDAIRMENT